MKKIAFVLSSGGFLGCFQCGVMAQLEQKGIIPDVLYGTSVGAVNALGYAYCGATELLGNWTQVKSWYDAFSFDPFTLLNRRGFYNLNPLRSLLLGILSQEKVGSGEACVCYTDLIKHAVGYRHSNEEEKDPTSIQILSFLDATIASCSIPGVVAPVQGRYVDGSIIDPLPLEKAVVDGCTDIYVILNKPLELRNYLYVKNSLIQYMMRASYIMTHRIMMSTLLRVMIPVTTTLHVYAPSWKKIPSLRFDNKIITKLIEEGQLAEELGGYWKRHVHDYFANTTEY